MKNCTIEGCSRKQLTKLYCAAHYNRLRKHGDLFVDKPIEQGKFLINKTSYERFISLLENANKIDCVMFEGILNRYYTQIRVKNKTYSAHRLSLMLFVGMPKKYNNVARHKCRNIACFNYHHLEWGSYRDNAMDRYRDKTMAVGESSPSSKFTDKEILIIRKRIENGEKRKDISIEFGVAKSTIDRIMSKKTWKHI